MKKVARKKTDKKPLSTKSTPETLLNWIESIPLSALELIDDTGGEFEDPKRPSRLYRQALGAAQELRRNNPVLPELPAITDNPITGLVWLKGWCLQCMETGTGKHPPNVPDDLMQFNVVVQEYVVSRATLQRAVSGDKPKLKSYRTGDGPHLVSESDVERQYEKR